jgi:diacylglycerol kinase
VFPMALPLAQANPYTFWGLPSGSPSLYTAIAGTLIFGIAMTVAFMFAPARARRPIVATFTFLSGLFWVLFWLWPKPQGREPGDLPLNFVESVGFFLEDGVGRVGDLSNVLTAFLLGLGIFSLLRLHIGRLAKMQKDWAFSAVLLIAMVSMVIAGYWEWYTRKFILTEVDFGDIGNWVTATYFQDFLFDGLLQKMDAAMFSIIAFYIMSAAYRAFRVRSVEATILLATALIVMLSLLSFVQLQSSYMVNTLATGNPGTPDPQSFWNNFAITEIAQFIRTAFQSPGIRAIDFGIGVGALAMGLRLWLSLERGGAST